MQSEGLNINQVTTAAQLTNGLLNKSFKVGKHLRSDTIANICRAYPALNPTWLLLGEGAMVRNAKDITLDLKNLDRDEAEYYAGRLEREFTRMLEPTERIKRMLGAAQENAERTLAQQKGKRKGVK